MSAHFAVLATLALAILFSPETWVLGLVIASDKKVPRQASLAFAIGGVLGPPRLPGPSSSCAC